MTKRSSLLLLVLGAVGCEQPAVRSVPPGTRASAATSSATSATRTPVVSSVAADSVHSEVRLTIPEACQAFATIFTASARAKGMSEAKVGSPRDTTMSFGGMEPEHPESACRVAWSDEVSGAPLEDVFTRATAAGWTERDHLLSADGPDGSVLAFSHGDVACLVRGSWDGGDDSDSTYVPAPGFEISASCFVNRPDRY